MRPQGIRSPRSLLILVVIVIVVVDRAQEMGEGPLGHVAPLLPRLHVRKAKVDTLVDTGIVCSGVRPLLKRAPRDLTSLYAVAYPWLVRDGGLGARNCEGLVKVKGVTT